MRRYSGLASLAGAWLLTAALLFLGGQGALSRAGIPLEKAVPEPAALPAGVAAPLQGAAVLYAPASLTVSEPNNSATFLVTLATAPANAVSIALSATGGQCSVSPASISLNPSNWGTGNIATVTAIDDAIVDGSQPCLVAIGPTTSDDLNYDGLDPQYPTVTVADDDVGVVVVPTALAVGEPDGSGTFVLTLTDAPAGTVSIPLSTASTQCTVSPATATLDGTSWETGATATVRAVDDDIDDGLQECLVVTGPTDSTDPRYDGLDPADVTVAVEDDDQAGVTVAPTSFSVDEPDGSGTFLLTLTSQPADTVSIPLSTAGTQCAVSSATATLDETNWATGATATVTAIDDNVVDGTQACLVQTGLTVSGDPGYDGLNPPDVTVSVADDDTAGVTISPTSLGISEPDGSGTFVARLTSQPLANVSIPLSASNTQCSVAPAALILSATNWASGATATVTAVDDAVADGDADCLIVTGLTGSGDPNYQLLNPADVTVRVSDDDEISIVVHPTTLIVSEPSGSDVFTLRLASQPLAAVSVPLSAFNSQCTVSPGTATLDASNWDTGVTATVTAVDDHVIDGAQGCLIQTGDAVSDDALYDGRNPADVSVTVGDDDMAAVTISPTSLGVSEPTGSSTFVVRLASQPVGQVSFLLSASNSQCSVSPTSILLDGTNWSTGVTARVTAVDDLIADGDQTCVIQTGLTVSSDSNYLGLTVPDVTVTVADDDEAGVVVAPTTLTVSEPSGSATFLVTLTSRPTAEVFVSLSVTSAECTVSASSIVVQPANWATGASVQVTAVDDDLLDGPQVCLIETGLTASADGGYLGLAVPDVTVTVQDDDRLIMSVYLPLGLRSWPPVPGVPALQPVGNPDGDGSYTVAWDAAARAETYVLEEAKANTFASAVQVYAGAATSYGITGRGAARYYYRVKARNSWSDSAWSNVQQVDVLWEAEPNDDALTQANGPIVSGLTYYGTFPSAADVKDYYYFDLQVSRVVELALSNIASGENYDLVLRNAGLGSVGYSAEVGNASEHILTGVLPAGRYYVQVFRFSGVGSAQPYHLRVDFE